MSSPASLKQLEVLVKIVECGGLSEAAAHLNVSPSAVSKSLAQLESQLGTTLIKRTTRSFTLTEPGQYLYNRATQLLLDFNESLNTTAGYYNHPNGELRITCSMALVIPIWQRWRIIFVSVVPMLIYILTLMTTLLILMKPTLISHCAFPPNRLLITQCVN